MDTHLQNTVNAGPVKPIVKRRQYSKTVKRQIVEECLAGSDSASVVARRHDINANLLFKWRRQYEAGAFGNEAASPTLVPVVVAPPGHTSPPASVSDDATTRSTGRGLEIYLADGHRLVVAGAVCPVALRTTLEVLSK